MNINLIFKVCPSQIQPSDLESQANQKIIVQKNKKVHLKTNILNNFKVTLKAL